jgi:trk system potassium uptake protein TrkH
VHLLPILRIVGTLLIVLGGAQLLPLGVALYNGEEAWRDFLGSGAGAAVAGGLLVLASRNANEISEKDGFGVVTFCWMFATLAGAVPYYLSGTVSSVTDAVFESMSGFTTTGATILTDFEGLGQGILLWRSLTQWFGGMGIIVLALVILPALGIGGMQLYRREVPGPYSEKITPRLRDTARALWSIYIGVTLLEGLLLFLLGMTPFEALNHALTTAATGGFSTRAGSIGEFGAAIQWTIIVFMLLGGMNFALHYRCLMRRGHRTAHFKDLEWKWFVGLALVASVAVSAYLFGSHDYGWAKAFTRGTFQVVSIITTTGYHSDDYVLWGAFPQIVLLLLMIAGGCAGSTSGGIKMARLVLVFKFIRQELLRLVHPKVVVHVKLGHARVTPDIIGNIQAYLFLYMTTLAVVTLLIALDDNSILTSFGAAVSALSNIGPGLDAVGPSGGFAGLSTYVKWVMIAGMLMGRLELMTVFVLFTPRAWRG